MLHFNLIVFLFQTSASFFLTHLFSMFPAIKNSFWLNNSIIYHEVMLPRHPLIFFSFNSAILFKNQKHLQSAPIQGFFLGKYSILYTFFSLSNLPQFYTLQYSSLLYTPNMPLWYYLPFSQVQNANENWTSFIWLDFCTHMANL